MIALLVAMFVLAAGAAAGKQSVQATLSGRCTETDTLDANGALKSATIACTGLGKCACEGSTQLDYSVKAVEPGTGAPGTERGTLTASGPTGMLRFELHGKHSALGAGTGTWKLVKAVGYKGVHLSTAGTYSTSTVTLRQVPQSMTTIVKIATRLSCWQC